jgi:hypothetical protein
MNDHQNIPDGFTPGYWMHETSGVLRPAVEAYLHGEPMTPEHIAAMRAYLRQWMRGGWGPEAEVQALRERVDTIRTQADVRRWLRDADELCIDPL